MAQAVVASGAAVDDTDADTVTDAEVIAVRALTHRFGRLTAVDGVDLTVRPGEIYGFLGRNGAGKTTLIRALLGLLRPTAGQVRLFGTQVRGGRTDPRVWARVGYLVEGPGLYPQLTVRDHLGLTARYRGLGQHDADAVSERLGLAGYADVPARQLSLGTRQRLGLALALVHRPALLVLDEPVSGLDPAGVVDVRILLRELADGGATVFMSSHLVVEVARLADRVGIIHEGRLVTELSGARIDGAAPGHRLVATFRTTALAERAQEALTAWGVDCVLDQTRVTTTTPVAVEHPDTAAVRLVEAGAPPMSLTVEHEDLEHVFLRRTSSSVAADSVAADSVAADSVPAVAAGAA